MTKKYLVKLYLAQEVEAENEGDAAEIAVTDVFADMLRYLTWVDLLEVEEASPVIGNFEKALEKYEQARAELAKVCNVKSP